MPAGPHRSAVRRIGLTGGIGSGKSTVGALLQARGAHLIDTDAIARELSGAGGAAIAELRAAFGDEAIDDAGALDRARMRARAFADPLARSRLEAILHPLIAEETARRAHAAGAGAVLVFDVPLLVESGRWRARVDRVLVVDCSEETQVERVVRRAGWDAGVVRSVIAQQASRAARRACADAVIFNDGIGLDRLEDEVHALWKHWCETG
jgi:dephospho-CoA kinase